MTQEELNQIAERVGRKIREAFEIVLREDRIPPDVDDDITAILARADAATPGEWVSSLEVRTVGWPGRKTKLLSIVQSTLNSEPGGWLEPMVSVCILGTEAKNWDNSISETLFEQAKINAAFIAASRVDVPRLCREVLRLRAEVRRLGAELSGLRRYAESKVPHPKDMPKSFVQLG